MKKIGITGGIGSGKSYIAEIFKKEYNIPIYHSDGVVKYLMKNSVDLKEKIIEVFGKEAYTEDGNLNRGYLAGKLFHNESATFNQVNGLVKIKEIIEPFINNHFNEWYEQYKSLGHKYCLFESAIIFENRIERMFHGIICVISPLTLRMERIQKRDPFRGLFEINSIIDKQIPQDEKACMSDFVITNGEKSLMRQIHNIHQILVNESSGFNLSLKNYN